MRQKLHTDKHNKPTRSVSRQSLQLTIIVSTWMNSWRETSCVSLNSLRMLKRSISQRDTMMRISALSSVPRPCRGDQSILCLFWFSCSSCCCLTAAVIPRKYTERDTKPKYITCTNKYDLIIWLIWRTGLCWRAAELQLELYSTNLFKALWMNTFMALYKQSAK